MEDGVQMQIQPSFWLAKPFGFDQEDLKSNTVIL